MDGLEAAEAVGEAAVQRGGVGAQRVRDQVGRAGGCRDEANSSWPASVIATWSSWAGATLIHSSASVVTPSRASASSTSKEIAPLERRAVPEELALAGAARAGAVALLLATWVPTAGMRRAERSERGDGSPR